MKFISKRASLLIPLACLAAGAVVFYFRNQSGDQLALAKPTSEEIRARLNSAWEQRLAKLGKDSTQDAKDRAAKEFANQYAQEIAQQEQLADAEQNAPYLGRVEAISNHASARVRGFDEVRRKLSSGELSELPPELAPPAIPQLPSEPVVE